MNVQYIILEEEKTKQRERAEDITIALYEQEAGLHVMKYLKKVSSARSMKLTNSSFGHVQNAGLEECKKYCSSGYYVENIGI